jgi:alpha-1,3-mannosyltransferase
MNVLLYLPGLLVVFWKTLGLYGTLSQLGLIVSFQVLLALPFLTTFPLEYLANAFNFSRAFLYKWTVNWRFVDDETFLSGTFAKGLLAGHLVCIVGFALFKWCRADGGVLKVLQRGLRRPNEGAALAPTSPDRKYLSI